MSAKAFITNRKNGGKAGLITASLGALFYGGMRVARYAKIAENPNSISPLPVNITGVPVWIAGKLKGEKAAKTVQQVIEAPGKFMQLPGEAFVTTGEGSFSQRISGKKNTQKLLGENADEKLNSMAMKTSSLGGTIANGLGNVLEVINKQFDFSGKADKKIQKKREELAALRGSFDKIENPQSRWDKIRAGLGMETKKMASAEEISKSLKEMKARKKLSSAAYAQREYDSLSTLEKLNRHRAAEAINEKYAKERKAALETGLKGVKGKKAKAAKSKEILSSLQQSYTKEEQAIIEAATPKAPLDQTEAEVLGKIQNEAKGKISSKVKRTVGKYAQAHEDINELERKKKFWEKPAEGIKERARNMTLSEAADYAMRYGAVVQQSVQSVKSSKIELRTLKQLMADLNGSNPRKISTFKVLFSGDVPAPVKMARKQFWRATLATYIPLIGGTIGQEKAAKVLQRKMGKDSILPSLLATTGFMALQNIGGLLTQGGNFLQTYADLRIAQEEGAQLDAQHYANLLENASADIKDMGGVLNQNTVLIAQYYAINQTPIAEVMQDIKAGKEQLIQRSHDGAELMKQMAAQQQAEQPAAAMTDNQSPVQGAGKFTGQERNQPKGGPGSSFTERALASQEQPNNHGLS